MNKIKLTNKDKIRITVSFFNTLGVIRTMYNMTEKGEKLPKEDYSVLMKSLQKDFFSIFDMLKITNTQTFIGCLMTSDEMILNNENKNDEGDK